MPVFLRNAVSLKKQCHSEKAKPTKEPGDPSTALRSAQDDTFRLKMK